MQHYLQSFALDVFRLCIWLVLLIVIFVPLETFCSQNRQKVFRKGFIADLGYYFLNSLLPKFLLILPISIIAKGVHHIESSGLYAWIADIPLLTRFMLVIIVGEFGSYWGHRWSHEIPLLWRFHSIHHSAEEMDWLVNTRTHPLDMFFTRLCGLIPIYLLGLAQPTGKTVDLVPLLYALFGTIWSFFIHANICWRFGWLEKLVATPAFHHWHHTNDGEKYINKNYAAIFPWVDKFFGTFYLPKNRWPSKYGIDIPIAPSFAGQLVQPLKWQLRNED
ncbi:sterol desaturase family protein [Anabaena cylindrica UHCC 0172]|uniref:sterol desaturase family protein n=1 Tax=Anabaena cylindrica TaxID=1165 RepID=UPI002B218281|nr:sterol desaturase family protein [Anabaena cylindrica]MEA5549570.1 sterol desaturase family protein [Anabaena cylindrica UHCC 0172]